MTQANTQSPFQESIFGASGQNLHKRRYQIFIVFSNVAWFPYFLPNIFSEMGVDFDGILKHHNLNTCYLRKKKKNAKDAGSTWTSLYDKIYCKSDLTIVKSKITWRSLCLRQKDGCTVPKMMFWHDRECSVMIWVLDHKGEKITSHFSVASCERQTRTVYQFHGYQ